MIFDSGGSNFIQIDYNEKAVGEGYVTVPYQTSYNEKALLTVTLIKITIGTQTAVESLLYKWTGDDGLQLARLYSFNDSDGTNFNEYTYQITGTSRLAVERLDQLAYLASH